VRLPRERIRGALPGLIRRLRPAGLEEAAEAIQTTDRFRKFSWAQTEVGGRTVTLCGMAKGAGMICPNMATMLAFFLTDLKSTGPGLRSLLKQGASRSFNRINGTAIRAPTTLCFCSRTAAHRTRRPGPEMPNTALLQSALHDDAGSGIQDRAGRGRCYKGC